MSDPCGIFHYVIAQRHIEQSRVRIVGEQPQFVERAARAISRSVNVLSGSIDLRH
jgi:hypothetical protein